MLREVRRFEPRQSGTGGDVSKSFVLRRTHDVCRSQDVLGNGYLEHIPKDRQREADSWLWHAGLRAGDG